MERSYAQMAREAEMLRAKASRENGDMARLLADARALLGETNKNSFSYDDEESYYGRVA